MDTNVIDNHHQEPSDMVDEIQETSINKVFSFFIHCIENNESKLLYLLSQCISISDYECCLKDKHEVVVGFNLITSSNKNIINDITKIFKKLNYNGIGNINIMYAYVDDNDQNVIENFRLIQTMKLGNTTLCQIDKLAMEILMCSKLKQVGVSSTNITLAKIEEETEISIRYNTKKDIDSGIVNNICNIAKQSKTVSLQYESYNTNFLTVSNILQHTTVIFDDSNLTYKGYLEDKENDDPIMNELILGQYKPQESSIYLYSSNIKIAAESIKQDSRIVLYALYRQVFLHELAHAIMDETHELNSIGKWIVYDNVKINYTLHDKCFQAMEESLANHVCLSFIESIYGNKSLDYKIAMNFISSHQPDIYKFGIIQHALNVDWNKWLELKKKGHSVASDKRILEWYKTYVLSNQTYISPFDKALS